MLPTDIPTYQSDNPSLRDIEKWTQGFSKAILVTGISAALDTSKTWNIDFFRARTKGMVQVEAPVHTAAYWASNSLEKELASRNKLVNFEDFFGEGSEKYRSGYYIAYYKFLNSVYRSGRQIDLNPFDHILAEKLPELELSKDAILSLVWISMGGTKSLLHGDPLHNCLLQITGSKTFVITSDRQDFGNLRHFKTPHLLSIRDPRSTEALHHRQFQRLIWQEVCLHPGDMLVLPFWTYHYVETPIDELNITLTNLFYPTIVDRALSRSYWMSRFMRLFYPKIVKKNRLRYQLTSLGDRSVPFFPPMVEFLQQGAELPNWNRSAKYYLLNKRDIQYRAVIEKNQAEILRLVDGKKDCNSISQLSGIGVETVLMMVGDLIRNGYLMCFQPQALCTWNFDQIFNEIN